MTEERYVIIDIHPNDAFYEDRNELIGKTVTIPSDSHYEIGTDGYSGGYLRLHGRLNEEENPMLYFWSVMIAPLSEVENK